MRKVRLKSTLQGRLAERLGAELNDEQRAAATAPGGYNLVLAGPGSGKTRAITYRVAHLIASGVSPGSIMLVTFTRRAAREMTARLEALIGAAGKQVWAGTFHHIGSRLIRAAAPLLDFGPNFSVLDSEDQVDLVRLAMSDAGFAGTGKMAPKPAALLHLISFSANVNRPLNDVLAERQPDWLPWRSRIEKTAAAYARRKHAANSMDYDDLLLNWRKLLLEFDGERAQQGRLFQHLLVDEAQDTNALQMEIIEALAAAGPGNLTIVGDDAQSIYRFRGANYDNVLRFPERHPGARVYHLNINYRSTPQIVALTRASIAHNTSGFAKELVSARPDGLLPWVVAARDAHEEAAFLCQQILEERDQGLSLGEMAVLYRNHHDGIVLQGELLARGVPYTVRSGLRFFEQAHVKDVLAYLRVIANPRDAISWRRLLLLLPGIGPANANRIAEHVVKDGPPLESIEAAATMALVPTRGRGAFAAFVGDLRRIRAAAPERDPSAAIAAVLKSGYPEALRLKYDRPDNRLADLEQFTLLAARYDGLDRLVSDMVLAGDVYGVDSLAKEGERDALVLSTVHQAKGLEWSHVFIPRLIEDSFPHWRSAALQEDEEEERRTFYVAVSRAQNQLVFTHPLSLPRGGRGPSLFTRPSRFLQEVEGPFVERVELETGPEIGSTNGGPRTRW